MATTIGFNGYSVSTVEHIMAAFFGMGIDNALVQIDGGEVPIMDGSSAPFVFLLKNAGVTVQNSNKKFLVVKKPVKVEDGNRSVHLYPSNELKITYKIDFNHPLIKDQTYELSFSQSSFIQEISKARTFGFLKDVETLQNNGLAQGGSLDNLAIIGHIPIGHFVVERSGHTLNQQLLRKFMAQEKYWEVVRFKNRQECSWLKIPSFGALDLASA
jgi:UDP-3-O-[3-hydroxymyristoyl] N-acetylglucosamine deacetylase